MGYNCNLGTRGFLWWLGWPCSTAMWDLGFLGGGHLRITCHWPCPPCCPASQCMSSCIALLSPEVRWSEMEWHVSLVYASRLSVRCEMNGLFYTSIFCRNECGGFHVRRAVVCGWLFTLGTLLFRWGAVLRGIWVAGLFHLLLGSFCYFTALFPNDIVIRLICCFCFKKVHPCVVKSDAWAIWAKPCLLHLIVFPFFDCFAVLLCTQPQDVLMTVRASSAHGMSKKKCCSCPGLFAAYFGPLLD